MNNFDWNMQAHNAVNEMDRDQPRLSGPTITFMTGAEWQREQLRAPEAIERVAIRILADDAELTPAEANEDWGQMVEDRKRLYRDSARAHITALLGED